MPLSFIRDTIPAETFERFKGVFDQLVTLSAFMIGFGMLLPTAYSNVDVVSMDETLYLKSDLYQGTQCQWENKTYVMCISYYTYSTTNNFFIALFLSLGGSMLCCFLPMVHFWSTSKLTYGVLVAMLVVDFIFIYLSFKFSLALFQLVLMVKFQHPYSIWDMYHLNGDLLRILLVGLSFPLIIPAIGLVADWMGKNKCCGAKNIPNTESDVKNPVFELSTSTASADRQRLSR